MKINIEITYDDNSWSQECFDAVDKALYYLEEIEREVSELQRHGSGSN